MSRENPRELIKRARASVEMGRPEVGLPLATQAAALAPNDAWVLTNLAWLQYTAKRYDAALRTCGHAIAANPEYEWAHRVRGYILWWTGNAEAAASALADAVRLRPHEPRALWTFAWFASVVGRSEEALRAAERAVEVDPQNPNCWFALGWASWSSQDWERAESALVRSRSLDPADSAFHNNLGSLYAKIGRLDDAIACFRSALSIDPRSVYAYRNLARALRRLDRWSEATDMAVRHYLNRLHEADERVKRIGDCAAYMDRAEVEAILLRLPAVKEDLRRAEELVETSWAASTVKRLGMLVALESVDIPEALTLARQLLRDHSDYPPALEDSAQVAWMAGDAAMAEEAARLAKEQEFGWRTESVCRARVALANGRWRAARDELETFITTDFSTSCCAHAEAAYAAFNLEDPTLPRLLRTAADANPNCSTLRVLDQLELMPVKDLLPPEIRPWLLSERPLG